ncbi:hypothetical protein EYF80_060070 [Liparis tanakae]|uniref:Uncharacterized protein n=1 Tax=Liparis tanakae TaxID=230148 RepID=A0A4Z2ELQ9_9TELE|nr:hypothetical protein EYF80_060070 [Liparis tanakae]
MKEALLWDAAADNLQFTGRRRNPQPLSFFLSPDAPLREQPLCSALFEEHLKTFSMCQCEPRQRVQSIARDRGRQREGSARLLSRSLLVAEGFFPSCSASGEQNIHVLRTHRDAETQRC